MNYAVLKLVHIVLATITVAGFILRGAWMLSASHWLDRRVVRIAPHIVDTLLLASGVYLLAMLRLPVLDQPWLLAKMLALLTYIVLGAIALRRGPTLQIRRVAFALALVAFAYMLGAAILKSALSWGALLAG